MAKMRITEEFPCGYKYSFEASSILGDMEVDNRGEDKGCPLHGKKCKK